MGGFEGAIQVGAGLISLLRSAWSGLTNEKLTAALDAIGSGCSLKVLLGPRFARVVLRAAIWCEKELVGERGEPGAAGAARRVSGSQRGGRIVPQLHKDCVDAHQDR